ncbi:MAG: SEL1-like repeat protein [Caulobacterales bacterium]|nr:SEL1-like repeat protein [Caulobacterales bacterium]
MSGAQSWSVKGIDPKVREAAREAAARQGMSLGEYLNQALAGQPPGAVPPPQAGQQAPRPRPRIGLQHDDEIEDDWSIGAASPRTSDPTRLAQRIESIERRTQLAVTGLDRAVSTIDRSVLGLAARIEDAEAVSGEAADRVADALEQFRIAGETLSGKLERAEYETNESRRALEGAKGEITGVRERLEQQVSIAEEVARRAEAAASYLTSEMGNREAAIAQTLNEARAVAEEAARQASEASADAVAELRRLQEEMSERLAETETSTRRAVATAIEEVRSESATESRGTREALLEEVVRLESEISKRVGAVDELRSEHAALISRIERAEAGARESTAGLRQAAGAAIADLRNAQLTLAARVKQVEDVAGSSGAVDVSDLRHAQQDIAERLSSLESKTASSPVTEALAAFEARLAGIENGGASNAKLEEVDGAVKTLDQSLQRLAERIAETESTANSAIRTLENTVSALGARVEQGGAVNETEAVRAMLEQRLDTMAQSVNQMVGEARSELADQLQAALEGVAGEGLEGALADVNRRLAAAERRQAQTIEAISLEIRRMSETVDKRLRAVESRNDDAAGAAVREELVRMTSTLEQRFDDIERREAAAFDRMGLEVGRLSERLEERVGAVETRSAQAIEHVGEQVARMAERFNQRHEVLSRELGERMLDSEERAGQRVAEAISSIMQRLSEVEAQSAEAIAPVQKAVSSVASKLEQYESAHDTQDLVDRFPTPTRRQDDFGAFGDLAPKPYVSPMDAAQPMRAGPLPPLPREEQASEDDIYFAEDVDDLLTGDPNAPEDEPFTPEYKAIEVSPDDDLLIDDPILDDVEAVAPPPQDDDPFWAPEEHEAAEPLANAETYEPAFDLTQPPPQEEAPAVETPPPGKNDYLANARKAALAQAQQGGKPAKQEKAAEGAPKMGLRGPSRIVVWGAAGLAALALVGGAKYLSDRQNAESTPAPEPETTQPTQAAPAVDPNATFEAPAEDPFAAAPGEAPAEGAPVAENGAPVAAVATPQPASNTVVAGPLAPRSVSLEQAAQSGDLTAQYELGLQRISGGRTQEGVTLLRRAADRGFAMAQYRLAKLYERGEGVQADLAVARQWTERAAAAGNRRAMHDLGVYFARGEGAPLDEAAAFRWFRQAAELGVADSQYNLGVLYQQGRGVNASASEALFWFMVAARQGDQDAGARATALETQLAAQQVEQARARAQAFRPRAASAVANGEFGPRAWATRGA